MANCFQKNFPAEDDYPNFTGHKSLLAKHCSKELYAKLRDTYTASGFTLDKLIQNGTDNSGKYNKYFCFSIYLLGRGTIPLLIWEGVT